MGSHWNVFLFHAFPSCWWQFRANKGALPEAGDMDDAEAVFDLAKACNEEGDGSFKAEGLDDSKVRAILLLLRLLGRVCVDGAAVVMRLRYIHALANVFCAQTCEQHTAEVMKVVCKMPVYRMDLKKSLPTAITERRGC